MAKRKAKLESGATVHVRQGVKMPEFETLDIGGWSGMILETQGKGPAQKVILEWSGECMSRMPPDYVTFCESQGLFHGMACLAMSDLEEPAGE